MAKESTRRGAPTRLLRFPRLRDQPLIVQFLTAGGLVAFFSVVSLVLLFSQVESQARAARFLAQTHRVVGALNSLARDYVRQETAVLEYLRTRDNRFLNSVHEQRRLWDEGLAIIEQASVGSARETELLGELRGSYQSWRKVTDALVSQVNTPNWQPEESAPAHASLREESTLFKETFLQIDRFIHLQSRQLAVRDESEKAATRATFTAISAIQILLLVIFGIGLAKLYLSIAQPISELSMGMRRYRSGDFGARVPASNDSEIGYLQIAFNEMAEKIEAMVADLRKLDQLKSEFLSTVSHELRTPLTSIGGYTKLLSSGDAGPVTETQREFLYIIDTNVVRLTHLIDDILDVEKIEFGRMQIQREPQDLVGILKECRDTFGILASQKGLELRYSVPASLPAVLGDRSRLVQVFMNLLSNAIKYTDKGFVELAVETHGYAVTVRVRDSGVGLTEEEREKLFQKFYRTRSGLYSTEGGTGLGLVIVRGLIEAHGGTIAVDSEPGRGTSFSVTFPATSMIVELEPGVAIGDLAAQPSKPSGSPLWQRPIWIVDSDSEAVAQITRIIEGAGPLFKGYRLGVRVFDSLDAVPEPGQAAHDELPFIVVLDPERVGAGQSYGAISLLRRKLQRTVPVLVVSSTADAAEAFAEGASALLTKPIDEREFLIAVKDLIATKGWRVLVGDRNTDLRILLKRSLEQRGILVDDVDRGSQVMGRLEQEDYDLALLDVGFADVSARELLKVIRRRRSVDSLPVLLMFSEDKNPPSEQELRAWGANASVGKARGIAGIADSVCRYLEDRELIEHPN
jgi:signal transduction histidine kinase/CheY-like chemotaxis protein